VNTYDERKIVDSCIEKNRLAQKNLYNLHKVYLFGVCLRYAKSRVEAEDMLQDAFVSIFKDLHKWSGSGALRAWMRRVTINAALMHIRKYRKIEFSSFETDLIKHAKVSIDLSKIDLPNGVILIIQQLPEPYQTIFNLRAIDEYSFKEISTKLNTNEATLRSYYLRARKKLKAVIEKELQK